ncbi:G-protein coupled receptor dmsr-1-like [Dreissena polymorpha]|uniref:G-protein coupled receptors family 1 profile domain-containing protein n=1 Tax=Dreissena polymorpha TaxID=45954 RepID=A0A9D4ET16_DREPO|nr:G-protein coupled receptor dmsr-1-like [Dreissena polymorpha]KAH3785772.1 hypothetical protein DPMN_163866 [Dreissena polymorpha]
MAIVNNTLVMESTTINLLLATAQPETMGLQEFYRKYALLHGYFSIVVCLFGFVANIFNIVVLTRPNMITPTNVILTWLAVADMFTMLDYFPFALHFYIFKDSDLKFLETRGYGWMCYLLFHANFSVLCHSVAIWLTIALATFRFMCIWFPTWGPQYCTVRRAKHVIGIIIGSVIILCIPNCIINSWTTVGKNETNILGNETLPNTTKQLDIVYNVDYRSEGAYVHVDKMNKMIQAIIFKILPCFALACLTILLVTAMHRAYKKRMRLRNQGRNEESDRHGEHNRTTGMLLAVVVLFLLTEMPQGILTIMSLVQDYYFNNVYMPLGDVLDIMALCNNAINFVLYSTMSKQFRDTFVSQFCCCCPKKRPGWMRMKIIKSKTEQNGNSVTTHSHV